jgi:signal transduction histidine kinase
VGVLSPTEEELLSRLKWFVKLRWLFLLGLAGVLFFAVQVFRLSLWLAPILVIGIMVLAYNLGFFLLQRLVRSQSGKTATVRGLRIEANLQIGLDLLALVFLIHYSGGIENPFIFFFVFHMIMGSILLSGRDIWFQAAISIGLLFLFLALSYFNYIPHYRIHGFASDELWTNVPYILAGVVSFGATIFMTVYMTHSIAQSLRKREQELFVTKNMLERQSRELERANVELRKQQSLLIQSEKLASLGKLSAGIAHELNNPLTGVLSFTHFVKDSCPGEPGLQRDLDVVIRETERCKKIIKGLLDFARQSQPEKTEDNLLLLLERTLALVENHKDFKTIEILKDFPEQLPLLMIDRDQMQQVFMNLLVNAAEAMPLGGKLWVSARLRPGQDQVEIRVEDTGTGIAEENLGRIFDPFFTTKESGTGLGLSISLGIIENHGGKLEVASAPGRGSTFTVRLPVA